MFLNFKILVDKIQSLLDEHFCSVKHVLCMNKLPTYQTEQNNAVKDQLK